MSRLILNHLTRLLRHLWLDADDAQRALGPTGLARLETQVGASERQHSAQICLCIEASLPLRYLWRNVAHGEAIEAVLRDRALTTFGKQRVWDTAHNNGVLIYVSLAEHHIELLADRGLADRVPAHTWQTLVDAASVALRAGQLVEGLEQALAGVHSLLLQHFPASASAANQGHEALPDRPVVR